MRYRILVSESFGAEHRSVNVDDGVGFTSFPAIVGNPNYDGFLESQELTDEDVQAMEPDVWHEMVASVI